MLTQRRIKSCCMRLCVFWKLSETTTDTKGNAVKKWYDADDFSQTITINF